MLEVFRQHIFNLLLEVVGQSF